MVMVRVINVKKKQTDGESGFDNPEDDGIDDAT